MPSGETTPLLVSVEEDIKKHRSTSWFGGALIMANIVLGSGPLNFPNAYNQAGGIASAVSIECVSLVIVQIGGLLIGYCSDLSDKDNYQDVVHHYTGRFGVFWTNIFIVVHDFGACVTYLVIIADQIDQVMLHVYGPDFCYVWYLNRNFTLSIITVIIILPMCFPRAISSFKFASALGILTTVYLIVLVTYKYFFLESQGALDDVVIRTEPRTWTDVFKVIPTIVFSFEAHVEGVPVYASFRKRNMWELTKMILCSCLICVVVYNMVGIFGFLTFGEGVKSDILTSYTPIDPPVIVGMAMIAIKSLITYPVCFFCARLVILDLFKNCCAKNELQRHVFVTVIMFGLSVVIALLVPSIGSLITLLGGTAALFIFVLPGLCFMLAHMGLRSTSDYWRMALGFCFVVLGVFLIGTTTAQSIMSYASGEFSEREVSCS